MNVRELETAKRKKNQLTLKDALRRASEYKRKALDDEAANRPDQLDKGPGAAGEGRDGVPETDLPSGPLVRR